MARSETLELVKEFLFPGRSSRRGIPPLDGGLTPNDALDAIEWSLAAAPDEPDDVLLDSSGGLYVTSGTELIRLSGAEFTQRSIVATLGGPAGGLAMDRAGNLLVCVAGVGLVKVRRDGTTDVVVDRADDGGPIHCPTAVTVSPEGTIYITDGSSRHHGEYWVHDLMEQNALGRLVRHDPASGETTVLAGGLRYPAGVELAGEGDALLVSEAWAHRITRFPLNDPAAAQPFRENLPGYPGRIGRAPGGGYWLAIFALRTQLVEFVLTQRDYVDEMMRTIEPDYWIRPALRSLNSGLEPLQGGQIRKLGVIKPWAPPRSYGLVARLDEDGYPRASLHSRGGAHRHGVTAARQHDNNLLIAVRGGDQVLITEVGEHL